MDVVGLGQEQVACECEYVKEFGFPYNAGNFLTSYRIRRLIQKDSASCSK
jgi:hypothetical protein